MSDTQDKRIMGAGVCAGGMVNSCSDDLLPTRPVEHPKTRKEWKDRRDWCVFQGRMHEEEWIDRKILYPIGNIINGKYPDDEKFECERCKSHVGVVFSRETIKITKCIVCGSSCTISLITDKPLFPLGAK